MISARIIGQYRGDHPGPLVIALAGIHGNEAAGVAGLMALFRLLEQHPPPRFCGRLLALRGNCAALAAGKRFLEKDLNRQWTPENIAALRTATLAALANEDRELRELLDLLQDFVATAAPERIYVIDLHTFTAPGGPFVVPSPTAESLRLGTELHAPVVLGMTEGLRGTTLHYFNDEAWGIPTEALSLEAGQHADPQSVGRCTAAVLNLLRTVDCTPGWAVVDAYDQLLRADSRALPRVLRLVYRHAIGPDDQFRMLPGFINFRRIRPGQPLATDRRGWIYAPCHGRILMPLYQPQGEDGFFVVVEEKQDR